MAYLVLNRLRHSGQRYAVDASIELDEKAAEPLLKCGSIAPMPVSESGKGKAPAADSRPKAQTKTAKSKSSPPGGKAKRKAA